MTCQIQHSGAIELYFYGELPPPEHAEVQSHVPQCAECRRALEDLSVIRAALASRPDIATPPGGDWAAFMARLDGAIGQTAAGEVDRRADTAGGPRTAWRRLVPYLAAAALVALVTISVLFALAKFPRRDGPSTEPDVAITHPVRPGSDVARSADPALTSLSGQHFERSKLVVLGLATKDTTGSGRGDWAYERELATTLLGDTRLYRQAAEARGMNTLAGVMRDLELVLLQTSMSREPDTESLEQLQRLIRRRDLLTKMNVVYAAGP